MLDVGTEPDRGEEEWMDPIYFKGRNAFGRLVLTYKYVLHKYFSLDLNDFSLIPLPHNLCCFLSWAL